MTAAIQLDETWRKHKAETEALKNSLRTLNDKIEEAKRKKNILIARQRRAEAQKRIHETMSSIGDKSAFETFERMSEAIADSERKALASAELSEELSGDSLAKQFTALEYKADADTQLLALKQKMGLLSAGTPGEAPKQIGAGGKAAADVHDAELVDEDADDEPRKGA
jgi:phage shock protein A